MGEMTPETPLQLLSHAVDCLTAVIENPAVENAAKVNCELARDRAVNALLDLQTIPAGEAA